ncbi:MAG: ceramidase, partial [Bacteroidia bacterium]|nr:ceramidase [Bacteroidia bacterium]
MKLHLTGIFIIAITVILIVIGFAISEPIIQPEQYHQFSDTSTILGIPNFWNVISNLPFLIIGIAGVLYFLDQPNRLPYLIFFSGIALCFFGSCYYHWHPTTETLVWDRLPMTVGFMALVS